MKQKNTQFIKFNVNTWFKPEKFTFMFCLLLSTFINLTAQKNIALDATVTTSYVSDWESLEAVNDGNVGSNSTDRAYPIYGNWDSSGQYQWVEYEWPNATLIESVKVYWFTDNGGLLAPDDAYIEYFEDGEWSITTFSVSNVLNQFNEATVGVTTSKIRLQMKSNTQSVGIVEFEAYGDENADFEAPTASGTPIIVSTDGTSLTLKFDPASDNIGIESYDIVLNDEVYGNISDTIGTISDIPSSQLCLLKVVAKDAAGNSASSNGIWVYTGAESEQLTSWDWPSYSPTIAYDFRDEFPDIEEPTEDLIDCDNIEGTISDRWWSFVWGKNARSEITEAAVTPMLERLNTDFAYFRDVMGWPPDKRNKRGYRSAVYLFGSGLCTDDADTTALGGWMGATWFQNESWPMILASYYPVYSFDPSCPYGDREGQMGAMVHEGIHAVLADMPGCKNAAWFHEGGNTWLQQEMESKKANNYSSMGFLNSTNYLAPFMPIECYTGWLQDDSFGGPSAEGVNMHEGDQQICTWRNLLGGGQYGNAWPTFMGQTLGDKSVAWVWRYSTNRVLDAIGDSIGEMQIRKLIMEYRAKQALLDMKEWSGAFRNLLNAQFGMTIKEEWEPAWLYPEPWIATPYARTAYDDATKTLTPEWRTTPGWSGGNQIPLNTFGASIGDTVMIDFIPEGSNMTCQLCYRDTDGNPVYGKPVSSGKCGIKLESLPANKVVIAVITNTDYIYKGEETRKAHFTYKLKLLKGVYRKASVYKKWFNYDETIVDVVDDPFTAIDEDGENKLNSLTIPSLAPINNKDYQLQNLSNEENSIKIFDLVGNVVYMDVFNDTDYYINSSVLPNSGMYIVVAMSAGEKYTYKIKKR